MIYLEQVPGDDWNERIDKALSIALKDSGARTIILPPRRIEITRPIFCWRHEMTDDPKRIKQSADIQKIWQVINGAPNARARGIRIVGEGGMSGFAWNGDPFEVMLDIPSPWYITLRDVNFWGNKGKGNIGLRLRGGWELQSESGKSCLFERCLFKDLDCGVEVGDPFHTEMSSMDFRLFRFRNCQTGMRFLGGNVSQMRIQSHQLNGIGHYGYHVQGYEERSFRRSSDFNTPSTQPIVMDSGGREIFFDNTPEHLKLEKVSNGDSTITGPYLKAGKPSVIVDGVSESSRKSGGTLFFVDRGDTTIANVDQTGASDYLVKESNRAELHVPPPKRQADQDLGSITFRKK